MFLNTKEKDSDFIKYKHHPQGECYQIVIHFNAINTTIYIEQIT